MAGGGKNVGFAFTSKGKNSILVGMLADLNLVLKKIQDTLLLKLYYFIIYR